MPIYIACPKPNTSLQSFNLSTRKLLPECRQTQVNEVITLHTENTTFQDLQSWIRENQNESNLKLIKQTSKPGVTGTIVVEMPPNIAERMEREIPNALILKDTPIELIKPQKNQASGKSDPKSLDLWHLDAIGLNVARTNGYPYTGKGITVAVLDTGIDAKHPELLNKVAGAYRFVGEKGKVHEEQSSFDLHGHGTHVAGLICGKSVGIAPNAQLINGLMLSQERGMGSLSDLLLALDWVALRNDIQIVNISAGIPTFVDELEVVIRSLLEVGVLPICAAGNSGRDFTASPGNCRGTLSVGASTRENLVWGDSGSGQTIAGNRQICNVPSLVAPGKDVYSCVAGGRYESWDGTSMATPIVSGVAALALEAAPYISVGELREILLRQCYKLPKESNDRQGAGLIQILHTASK